MAESKTYSAVPRGALARLEKPMRRTAGEGGSARVGFSSVLSFRRPVQLKSRQEPGAVEQGGGKGLHVAPAGVATQRDPVAHPKFKPRLEGAAKKIYQLCDDPSLEGVIPGAETISRKRTEVDIATFVEAVSAAYPQPRDPDVRPVLKAGPTEAARPFVYLPGMPEETVARASAGGSSNANEEADAIERAHRAREQKAFHAFLDRMESGPLESLDHSLAELDERAEARRRFPAPMTPYDPILEPGVTSRERPVTVREAPPVPAEERHLIEAVIEPLDPVAKPRFPQSPADLLPGGAAQRLSPSQRAHLKRPVTVRDRNGRIAPVTYSLNPRNEG